MKLSKNLKLFLNLSKIQSSLSRRFDGFLDGIGLSDFVILYHLSQAHQEKMRRIDLAEKVGLTASGVTRQLFLMEKIGLVGREVNKNDARSTYVTLAGGGKRKLEEAIQRAELFCEDFINLDSKEADTLFNILIRLGGVIN